MFKHISIFEIHVVIWIIGRLCNCDWFNIIFSDHFHLLYGSKINIIFINFVIVFTGIVVDDVVGVTSISVTGTIRMFI